MAKSIPIPKHSELIDYGHAVAGHDGTMADIDGELFIKPCTQKEIEFYEETVAEHPDWSTCIPTFLGILTLDEHHHTFEDASAALLSRHNSIEAAKKAPTVEQALPPSPPASAHSKPGKRIVTNQAIVLENASYGFVRPNIMDVKMGVQLWGNDAIEEKRIRFDKVTAETTHKDLGFRVAGMRIWQGHGAKGPDIDREGYRSYDKDYGRFVLNKDNVHEAFEHFLSSPSAGIDEELGKLVAQAFIADIGRIQAVLEAQESRMYSSSLLFVYEGDGVALRAAMEEASRSPPTLAQGDSENSEDDEECLPKIYSVQVIDFAHADWTPGQGPDESALLGFKSVTKILQDIADK